MAAFLSQLTRAQLRQLMVAVYSAGAALPADTDDGSSLGSIFDGGSAMGMELQIQIAYLAAIARMSTIPDNPDPNPDLDSFVNPFGVYRGGPGAASGQLVVVISTPVAVGATFQTPTGIQFAAIADPNNSNYSASGNDYPPTDGSVSVTVQCTTPGTIGNVQAGQITQPYTGPGQVPLVGFTSCTNPSAFINGTPYESNAALKTRFTLYIQTGRTATTSAISAAALATQAGLTYSVGDMLDQNGNPKSSYFTVVAALLGATSATPAPLLAAITQAITGNASLGIPPVKAAGISFQVISPTFVSVNANAALTVNSLYVAGSATAAFQAFIQNIGLSPSGASTIAAFGQVYAILYAVPGVVRVDNLLLNGSANNDITATFAQMLIPGTIAFTPA